MPTYRIPASLYVEAENVEAALHIVTEYLDDAAYVLSSGVYFDTNRYPDIVAVDVEAHQAEECPSATDSPHNR